ncbi:ComEA family DNA-binding protein, partial [Leifsonia sp. ku-ls]
MPEFDDPYAGVPWGDGDAAGTAGGGRSGAGAAGAAGGG